MTHLKKLIVAAMAVVTAVALCVPALAFAAGTGTITITPPDKTPASASNTYKVYKVFDADGNGTAISYKLVAGKTAAPAGFEVDDGGNVIYTANKGKQPGDAGYVTELTAADIAAIAAYVTEDDLVTTASSTGTADAVTEALPNGFYYITTSTGSVVTIDSTNPNAEVIDKNVIEPPHKKITGVYDLETGTVNEGSFDAAGLHAIAQLGSKVQYEATVTKTHGAKKYVFHDKMDAGLTYNNDVKVFNGATEVAAGGDTFSTATATGDTITITFVDSFIQGLADGTVLTIKYSATVNSDALTVDPAKNTASLQYGDNNVIIPSPEIPEVYNAKFTVTKQDGQEQPLAGAGFVIANADGAYYKIANDDVSWYTLASGETLETAIAAGKVTEYKSDAQGAVHAFAGLANGTYTLIESTVPAGYNKAADSTFTIAEGDYTKKNLEQEAIVINNAGSELPSTGGIGTTIFYIVGAVLVIGAGVVLITKRRVRKEEEQM